jgi:protein SCO1/2
MRFCLKFSVNKVVFFLLWTALLSAAGFCLADDLQGPAARQGQVFLDGDGPADPQDWIREHPGAYLPMDAKFTDEKGRRVTLAQLIDRPTLLLPVYYTCPSICSFDLANLAEAVRRVRFQQEGGYRVITLSFNAEETPQIAAAAKPNFTHFLPENFPEDRWSFLTGDRINIRKVTQTIGYAFKRQEDGIFLHPSAMVALDRNGQIIKYLYGSFITGDVELALNEAFLSTPSSSIRRFLAFCLPGNPRQNAQVLSLMQYASAAVLIVGGLVLIRFLRKKNSPPPPTVR